MDGKTARMRMAADLFASENRAQAAQHEVVRRAELYVHAGLPASTVLEALRISRATWYRRVEAARQWEKENNWP